MVVPVFLRAAELDRALCSVYRQTRLPDEVIVVDDGSPEGFYDDIKKRFPEIIWVRSNINQGVASARNLGIQKSSCEWIALLDSDDQWQKEKLLTQEKDLGKNRHFLALHTEEKWIRNGNEVIPPSYLNKSNSRLWERSLDHCLICPSSVILHRSVFEEVGWFDQSLKVCEDYDFWLRLLLHFPIFLSKEKLVIKHGGHADQLSTSVWGLDRFRLEALEKLLNYPLVSPDQEVLILERLFNKCRILSMGAKKRNNFERAEKYHKLYLQHLSSHRSKFAELEK